jgi:hypothetical protein
MFATIVTTGGHASFVKHGILRSDDFFQLWKGHPTELHPYMLSLLEQFEVVHRLDFDSSSSPSVAPSSSSSAVTPVKMSAVFVPCLLDDVADSSVLATHWPPYKSDETVFGRVYKFKFLFRGFFPLLTVRFLRSNTWAAEYYWRNGIILRAVSDAVTARLVLTDELQLTLYLRGGPDTTRTLSSLLSLTNALISDWLRKEAEVFAPCIRCLRHEVFFSHLFPLPLPLPFS